MNHSAPGRNRNLHIFLSIVFLSLTCIGCTVPCAYYVILPMAALPAFFGMKQGPDGEAPDKKNRDGPQQPSFQFKTLAPGRHAESELRVEKAGPVTVVVSYMPGDRKNKTRVQVFRKADDKAVNLLDDIPGEVNHAKPISASIAPRRHEQIYSSTFSVRNV